MPFIFKGATGDLKAQQSPNTQPAEISRQFKSQAVIPAQAQKRTPPASDGVKLGGAAGILAPHRQGNWLIVGGHLKLANLDRTGRIAADVTGKAH
jgi:hypothetical protein